MVWDRCYRLRNHQSQVRVDRTFTAATITGAAVAAVTKTPISNGIVISIPLALIAAAFYNAKIAEKPAVAIPAAATEEAK